MYEVEVNNSVESIDTVPADIVKRFEEGRENISSRTILFWREHCTECAWPTCYSTCELYVARQDGACRQFIGGVVRIDHKQGLSPYLQKIRFKVWAKLRAKGNLYLFPLSRATMWERLNIGAGAVARSFPVTASMKPKVLGRIIHLNRCAFEGAKVSPQLPDCFMLECYNPDACPVDMTLTARMVCQGGHAWVSNNDKLVAGLHENRGAIL